MKNYWTLYLRMAKCGCCARSWAAVLVKGDTRSCAKMQTGLAFHNDDIATTEILADIVSVLDFTKDDHLTVVAKHDVTYKIRAGWTFNEFTPGGYTYKAGVDKENRFWDAAGYLAAWAAE